MLISLASVADLGKRLSYDLNRAHLPRCPHLFEGSCTRVGNRRGKPGINA